MVDNSFVHDSFERLMSTQQLRIGVFGATGYAGRELIRLIAHHPRTSLVFATSESEAGTPLRQIDRAAADLDLVKAEDAPVAECDFVFSSLPHGYSLRWVEVAAEAGARVVDLSSDLRVPDP